MVPIADAGQADTVAQLTQDAGSSSAIAFHFVDLSAGGADRTSTGDAGVEIHGALYGDLIGVRLTGLTPQHDVTIHARAMGDDSVWYESYATVTAAGDGRSTWRTRHRRAAPTQA
jgi:hypothetical protein